MKRFLCPLLMVLCGLLFTQASFGGSPQSVLQGHDPRDAQAPATAMGSGDEPTENGTTGTVHVRTRLNVRAGPWGAILGKLHDGDKVQILGREGDWYKILWNGQVAYSYAQYISTDSSSSPVETPATPTTAPANTDSAYTPQGSLKPQDFGYSSLYQPIFDLAEKYSQVNRKYTFAAGHMWGGYPAETDCSGFTCHLYQMLAGLSGISPVFPKNQWFPNSQALKSSQYTTKITSSFPPPNPRDLIKPGDIFIMNPGSSGVGHVGVFMGYSKSGNPIIAHSTPRLIHGAIRGNEGLSGVRIEVCPSSFASRWAGIYRFKNSDQMLDKLSKKA